MAKILEDANGNRIHINQFIATQEQVDNSIQKRVDDGSLKVYASDKAKALSEQVANAVSALTNADDNTYATEVADARVGLDGTNYPSLGEAIRNQIGSGSKGSGNGIANIVNGKVLHLSDSVEGRCELSNLIYDELSSYEIKSCGKNIFDPSKALKGSDVSITVDGDNISYDLTSSDYTCFAVQETINVIPNTDYTVSIVDVTENTSLVSLYGYSDELWGKEIVSKNFNNGIATFNSGDNKTVVLGFYSSANNRTGSETVKIQVEVNNEATPYESYVGNSITVDSTMDKVYLRTFKGGTNIISPTDITVTYAISEIGNKLFEDIKFEFTAEDITYNNTDSGLNAETIQGAIDKILDTKANNSHSHTKEDIEDFPESLPASDVPSWAKEENKPTYSWEEIENIPETFTPEEHNHDDMYYTKDEIDGFDFGADNLTATVTGTFINIPDSIEGIAEVRGKTVSNLAEMVDGEITTRIGLTYVMKDGVLTVKGTPEWGNTEHTIQQFIPPIPVQAGHRYSIISEQHSSGRFSYYIGNGIEIGKNESFSYIYDATQDGFIDLKLEVHPDEAIDIELRLQVVEGEQHTFTPERYTVKSVGKNLFGGIELVNKMLSTNAPNMSVDYANKTITYRHNTNYEKGAVIFSDFKENTQYTWILTGKSISDNQITNFNIRYTDGSYGDIYFNLPFQSLQKKVFVTNPSKSVESFRYTFSGISESIIYYEECGIFEGVIHENDFESYQEDSVTITPTTEKAYINTYDGVTNIFCNTDVTVKYATSENGKKLFDNILNENTDSFVHLTDCAEGICEVTVPQCSLVSYDDTNEYDSYGVHFSIKDQVMSMNGTSTGNADLSLMVNNNIVLEQNETLMLNLDWIEGSAELFTIFLQDMAGNYKVLTTCENKQKNVAILNTDTTFNIKSILFRISGTVNCKIRVSVTKGSEPKPYAPYTYRVKNAGIQMLDENTLVQGYLSDDNGNLKPAQLVDEVTSDFIDVSNIKSLIFTLSGNTNDVMPNLNSFWYGCIFYDENKQPVGGRISAAFPNKKGKNQRISIVISNSNNAKYLRISYRRFNNVKAILSDESYVDLITITPETDKVYSRTYNGRTDIFTDYDIPLTVRYGVDKKGAEFYSAKKVLNSIVPIQNNAGYHNSVYRGKFLGNSVTQTQWNAIKSGSFDDLFIGDYWSIGGIDWRIAHFNYYLNSGDTACASNHVVIVPDTNLYSHVMNDSHVTTGGYIGSKMYASGLNLAKSTINNAFGASHILSHRNLFNNAVSNGLPSGHAWYNSTVELMTEQMVYGGSIFNPTSNGTTIPYLYRIDKTQLRLFAFDHSRITNRGWYWLRDIVSATLFALVHGYGHATCYGAGGSGGVRPAFCIY